MASQPKLEMSQEKIEAIDSKLSVAPDGSKFINPEVKANLTETETTEINKALTNFNKLSEATKDGRDSAMQVLEQEFTETKQVAFGEISASARCGSICHHGTAWWGITLKGTNCGYAVLTAAGGLFGAKAAITCALVLFVAGLANCGLAWAIITYLSGRMFDIGLAGVNKKCNSGYTYVFVTYWGQNAGC